MQASQLNLNDVSRRLIAELGSFFSEFVERERAIDQRHLLSPATSSVDPAAFGYFAEELEQRINLLQALGKFSNAWEVAGIGRREIRNVRVLSWILDPNAHHYGLRIWNTLLRRIEGSMRKCLPIPTDQVEAFRVTREVYPLSDTERLDIEICAENFYVISEAKIDARADEDQIERYLRIAKTAGIRSPVFA